MLEATRREAAELYVLFSLLSRGELALGDAEGKAGGMVPVVMILRREHDGMRRYCVEESEIHLLGEHIDKRVPREEFTKAADLLRMTLASAGNPIDLSDLEPFLDTLSIYDMEAQTDDRTDLHLVLWDERNRPVGIRIQSRLAGYLPLLDGGRAANIKYEQTGIRFSGPAVHKINWSNEDGDVSEVARRILYIESMGGVLKFSDMADKIFKSNLLLLDTNMPRILASTVMALHIDGISRISDLADMLEQKNPLKVKDELVRKHGFYRYKLRQLLLAAAWGMRPTKQWDGQPSAIAGYIMVDGDGEMLLYTRAEESVFADYLFTHTRIEKGSPEGDRYGLLERENGAYYLKLNLKISLTKR